MAAVARRQLEKWCNGAQGKRLKNPLIMRTTRAGSTGQPHKLILAKFDSSARDQLRYCISECALRNLMVSYPMELSHRKSERKSEGNTGSPPPDDEDRMSF